MTWIWTTGRLHRWHRDRGPEFLRPCGRSGGRSGGTSFAITHTVVSSPLTGFDQAVEKSGKGLQAEFSVLMTAFHLRVLLLLM